MRVVITGGAGFIGTLVARALNTAATFRGEPITQLVLADRVPLPAEWAEEPHVVGVQGDLADTASEIFAEPVDVLIHLAAAVSAECERDITIGLSANIDATRTVLEAARTQHEAGGPQALVLFASSVAVFGSDASLPFPEQISEAHLPMPSSSYGAQKVVCEQLVTDYSRKGFIDGRVVRLMTVAVRPGRPNAAASSFLSGIIREPLRGEASTCPVDPALPVALASPRSTVAGILTVVQAERGDGPGQLSGRLPVNLPALTVSVADMLQTLREIAGDQVENLVSVQPDAAIAAIVGSWPARFDNARAAGLGISGDESFADVVRQYIDDNRSEVRVHVRADVDA